MDASVLGPAVSTVAAGLAVSVVVRKSARRVSERKAPRSPDGFASFRPPSGFWKAMAIGGLALVGMVLVFGVVLVAAEGHDPLDQWQPKLNIVLGGCAGLLLAQHYRTWRLSCDTDGLHLRRLLLPDRDFPWEELDSVAFYDQAQGIAITAGGKKRAWFPTMYIGEGDDPALLREACEAHGVPICLEEEFPEGVPGPHGLARHGMSDKKKYLITGILLVLFLVILVAVSYQFAGKK